jgi:hypothetical protein
MIIRTFVLICDSFYIQWFVNLFPNVYLDLLEFEINLIEFNSIGSGQGPLTSFCEQGNESSY